MHEKTPFCVYATAVLLAPLLSAHAATNADLSVSVGAEYTSGDYGTSSKTKVWYFPVTLKYESDVDMLALTVPFLNVEGTGNVVVAGGGMEGGGEHAVRHTTSSTTSRTESGLGDLVVTGSHKIAGTGSSRVDLTGKIKLGTADEAKNLGTGENDYAVQLDMENGYNSNSIYGSIGYKFLGDPPGTDYQNVFYGSLGFSRKLDAARTAGVELYAQEAATSGGTTPLELTLYLGSKMDKKTKLTGYVLKGLSDGSPDWGFGVALKLVQ